MYETLKVDFDIGRTLEALEAKDWGKPNFCSHLVTTCHALRRKPLREFTHEDLRIMIGQNIGLPFLLPLAIYVFEIEPLAEGDFNQGDLLCAVLKCELKESKNWPSIAFELEDIAGRALKRLAVNASQSTEEIRSEIDRGLLKMFQIRRDSNQAPK